MTDGIRITGTDEVQSWRYLAEHLVGTAMEKTRRGSKAHVAVRYLRDELRNDLATNIDWSRTMAVVTNPQAMWDLVTAHEAWVKANLAAKRANDERMAY